MMFLVLHNVANASREQQDNLYHCIQNWETYADKQQQQVTRKPPII